ncbi:hypothetical protein Pan216_20850 [Planctomycetes bacterium Pan216]|uniref:Uncharacterized protein n=1 Tax=Kolteria novifilia TaxID=2527975 RepID=A0A518B2L2_9BACT|nr:hypothetical protein Pan216_20850 [Planctomycetes bacterium Pan216]
MAILWDMIGSFSFIALEGDVDGLGGAEVEDVSRSGVDGNAYRETGSKSEESELRGETDVASAAAADALIDSYRALEGTVVSIRLRQITRSNYLVIKARVTERFQSANTSGGVTGGLWTVRSVWRVVRVGS